MIPYTETTTTPCCLPPPNPVFLESPRNPNGGFSLKVPKTVIQRGIPGPMNVAYG